MSDLLQKQGIVTKEFSGKQYTLQLMSATDTIVTGQELLKLLAVPFGSAVDSGVFEDGIHDLDFGKNIAMALVSSMGQTDVVIIIKRLLSNIQENGTPVDFDLFFRGRDGISKIPAFLSWSIKEHGLTPDVFMQGFSETAGGDISQILSSMSQSRKSREETQKESQN